MLKNKIKEVDMAELNIVSVGIGVCGTNYVSHKDRESLSQYDIIIFYSNIINGLGLYFNEFSSGEKYLSKPQYEKLDSACKHWKKELDRAFKTGKLIFVISAPQKNVTVHSGSILRSKLETTYQTSNFDSYSCFPFELSSRNTNGTLIKSSRNKYVDITKELYEKLSTYTSFNTEFTEIPDDALKTLTTKTGEIVGFIREHESGGKYVFWPYLDMNNNAFTTYDAEKKQTFWTKEGEKVSNILIQELIKLYKTKNSEQEPVPDWVQNNTVFVSNKEAELLTDKKDTKEQIKALTEHLAITEKELEQEAELKVLLYGTGHSLENAVNKALSILGLQAENYKHPTETLEIDNLIKYGNMEIIGETEGKEKDIHNDKISQLVTNLSQYYTLEIDRLNQKPKGVLFGNPERKTPCENRRLTFTEKCMQISRTEKIALVLTKDLFVVALYLKDHPDESYKKACVDAIINTESGIVQFPNIPEKV